MRNTCINLRDLGIAILATVCVPLVQNCVYMIASALYNNRGVELPTSLLSYVVLILIFGCAYFICPWMYSSSTDHNKKPHKKSAKARKPVLRFFIIFMMCATLVAAGIFLQYFSTGILTLVDRYHPEFMQSYRKLTDSSFSLSNGALRVFTVILLAPIGEELVFRGVCMHSFERAFRFRFSRIAAVLLSSLLFGLYHGNIVQFCYSVPIGILFALVAEWTSSLLPGMFLHLVINGFSYILEVLPFPRVTPQFLISSGALSILYFVTIYILSRMYKDAKSHEIF